MSLSIRFAKLIVIFPCHKANTNRRYILGCIELEKYLRKREVVVTTRQNRKTEVFQLDRQKEFSVCLAICSLCKVISFTLHNLQSRPIEMRILHRNENCSKTCSAHFAPAAYFTAATLFFLPFCEWAKWRTKEGLKSSNQGYRGGLEH